MADKELLKTIQNDIKNLDKCIEMCIDDEGIDYLKTIQQKMREQEIKILKRMAIKKQFTVFTHTCHNICTKTDIWHKLTVHNINMNVLCTGFFNAFEF